MQSEERFINGLEENVSALERSLSKLEQLEKEAANVLNDGLFGYEIEILKSERKQFLTNLERLKKKIAEYRIFIVLAGQLSKELDQYKTAYQHLPLRMS